MKLLIITQKVDKNDSVLGFFHEWILLLSLKTEKTTVICLEKGEYDLPENVKILSLGKEKKQSRFLYILNFFKYVFKYKNDYDFVFIHMNAEYAFLGGIFWKIWKKKVLLWYMHKSVNWRLWLGEKFVDKIFTGSKESFRLASKKVEIVGHGINTEVFEKQEENIISGSLWLLSVGRISRSKDIDTAIKAVKELKKRNLGLPIHFSIMGDTVTDNDERYKKILEEKCEEIKNNDDSPIFGMRKKPKEMPEIYHRYQIFIHTSKTGSMDKVVLEALASGRIVITSSEAFAHLEKDGLVYTFPSGDFISLADIVEKNYKEGKIKEIPIQKNINYVKNNHSLDGLVDKIFKYYK